MISVRRRLAATSLAVTAALALTACGTSFGAQTNQVYQPAVGANSRGDVDVLNTLLVANRDGSATISAGLQNNLDAAQNLTSVEATTLADKPLDVRVSTTTELPLPSKLLVSVGVAGDAGGFVTTSGAKAGDYVKLTFSFTDSGPMTIEAPVVTRTPEYSEVIGGDGLSPAAVSGTGE